MADGGQAEWLARDTAERNILVLAIENGYVSEALPDSFVITAQGRERDFPTLRLEDARSTFARLATDGLVGVYRLTEADSELLGIAAADCLQADDAWLTPGSRGSCLLLTPLGERAVGIA